MARNLASDVDLRIMPFNHFGKGLVKTYKMSPDAFIQSALQLAHLRVRRGSKSGVGLGENINKIISL